MSRNTRESASLVHLMQAQFLAVQSQMAELTAQESALREALENLINHRTRRAQRLVQETDASMVAGADIRWHRWVDQRRAKINTELAQVLSKKEICRHQLKRAFGRFEAAKAVRDKIESERLVQMRRRRAYES